VSRPRRTRIIVLIVAVVALAIPVGGIASAYWTAGGIGAGAGNSGTLSALSLTPGSPGSTLYPGAQTNVVLTASNPNTETAHIASLVLDPSQGTGGFAVDGAHSGCSVATLSYTTQTNGGAGWTVPARVGIVNGTLAITLTNALSMGAAAASACQGATFTVYLAAN
jgi:hypothetical protein